MIYALSAALGGKITFADGGAVQKNFNDFTVLHMGDSPEFVVDIVRSTEQIEPARAKSVRSLPSRRRSGQCNLHADRQAPTNAPAQRRPREL